MAKLGRAEFQAGLFIAVGLFFMVITIFTLGKERQIFARQELYYAYFDDVKGLSSGAPIRLGGITIGRVDRISFSRDFKDTRVKVAMLINEEYLERLREDSTVSIETQGLLGDRMLSISSGTQIKQLLPGAEIKAESTGDFSEILASAGKISQEVSQISQSVSLSLEEFQQETMGNLSVVMKNLAEITSQIKEGDGTLHKLIYSETKGEDILKNIEETSKSLKEIIEQVQTGEGLLHSLIYDPKGAESVESFTRASSNLATSAEHISELAREIREGQGLLNSLIYGESPEGVDQIFERLAETAKNLQIASEALAQGGGTLGALLVDSSLYDNLVEVTDGAKRSFILRSAIRRSMSGKD